MAGENSKMPAIDPRTGLILLVLANIIAFTQESLAVEFGWIAMLGLLTMQGGTAGTD